MTSMVYPSITLVSTTPIANRGIHSSNPNIGPNKTIKPNPISADQLQSLISLLMNLIKSLQGNPPKQTITSAPQEPVQIGPASVGTTIGEVPLPFPFPFDPSQNKVLNNSDIVTINNQQYSIGALKSLADDFEASNYVPKGPGFTAMMVSKSWGSGGSAYTEAFERFVREQYPNGLM